MDNWWIYVLIILILAIRWVIKGAASQRQEAEAAPHTPVSGEITGSEWKDIFPKQEKRVKKPSVAAAKPNHAVAEKNTGPIVKEDIKTEAVIEEESKPYFSDSDDIKRGIIAAEILNRKY